MRLVILILIASLALATCGCSGGTSDSTNSSSNAQEIQPFSTLRWDDGLFEVVTKLNKFSGLKTLEWWGDPPETRSVLNVTKVEELSALLSAVIKRPTEEFKDHDGKTALSPSWEWSEEAGRVVAAEINIAGIPFRLEAILALEPGFAITYPKKIISFTTKNGDVKLPAVLRDVTLSSKSPTIPEKLNDLIATVKTKYPKGELSEHNDGSLRMGTFTAADETGHKFKLTWMGAEAVISYDSSGNRMKWAELYRKHLAALEEKENKGKQDSKSQL